MSMSCADEVGRYQGQHCGAGRRRHRGSCGVVDTKHAYVIGVQQYSGNGYVH
jgi:hypothetical protein